MAVFYFVPNVSFFVLQLCSLMALDVPFEAVDLWPGQAFVVDDFVSNAEASALSGVIDQYLDSCRSGWCLTKGLVRGAAVKPRGVRASGLESISMRINRFVKTRLRPHSALSGLNCSVRRLVGDTDVTDIMVKEATRGVQVSDIVKMDPNFFKPHLGILRRYVPSSNAIAVAPGVQPHSDLVGKGGRLDRCVSAILHLGSASTRKRGGALRLYGCPSELGFHDNPASVGKSSPVSPACIQRSATCMAEADNVIQRTPKSQKDASCQNGRLWNASNLPTIQDVDFRPGRLVVMLAESPHAVTPVLQQRDVLLMWWRGFGAWTAFES